MAVPTFAGADYGLDEDFPLLCPSCGSPYLHHSSVHVYARYEDSPGVRVCVASGDSFGDKDQPGRTTTDTDLSQNPSGRRGGVAVHFWCEGCRARSRLTFAQHKGHTHVNFVRVPD